MICIYKNGVFGTESFLQFVDQDDEIVIPESPDLNNDATPSGDDDVNGETTTLNPVQGLFTRILGK